MTVTENQRERFDKAAAWVAEAIQRTMMERHRGAYRDTKCDDHHWVLFGNDGYEQDEWARTEVRVVRDTLLDLGIEELGFGVAANGYTWAMIIDVRDQDGDKLDLRKLVWDAWWHACKAKPELTGA